MSRVFVTLIVIMQLTIAVAQKTTVICSARGAAGKRITLVIYEDFVSFKEKVLASVIADTSGNFQMSIPLKEITYAWFCIDYYKGELYLQPNTTHRFNLQGLLFNDETDKINANLEPQYINVQVTDSNDKLNISVQKLNFLYNRFLLRHLEDIRTKKFKKQMDTLSMTMDSVFRSVDIDYFKVYMKYRLAALELMSSQASTDEMFRRYILDQQVPIDNVEYMDFLSQYFENYFNEVNRPVNMSVLRRAVNSNTNYPLMKETFSGDSLLRNEFLLETVLLLTMKNLYALPGYSRTNIITILEKAATECKFEQHRKIAANLAYMLSRFEPGVKAPEFALLDATGDTVRLKDLKGKFVYLNFFTTWNIACLEELELMRKLYTKYGQSVHFVSVSCDREYMKLYHFARDNKYPWTMLHFNADYKLLDQYGVKTYPFFVLIDKNGNFISDPAENPSQNIELKLNEIILNSGNH